MHRKNKVSNQNRPRYFFAYVIIDTLIYLLQCVVFSFNARKLSTEFFKRLPEQIAGHNIMNNPERYQQGNKQEGNAITPEQKLRAFFDSSSVCHFLIAPDRKVLDFNKAAAEAVKRTQATQIHTGAHMPDYVSLSYRERFSIDFEKALKGERVDSEEIIDNENGVAVWWNVCFQSVRNDAGEVIAVAISAANITTHKTLIGEIMTQNAALRDIAYIQSHVYRKPVATILGLMNVIKAHNYDSPAECLLLMEHAVKELDEKIRSVVKHTQK